MQQLEDAPELVGRIERITVASVAEQLSAPDPRLLLDVRANEEYADAHIDSAANVPLSQLPERVGEMPSDRVVVVYCASGYRSAIASSLLCREGLPRVATLVGGLAAWNSAQLATVAL